MFDAEWTVEQLADAPTETLEYVYAQLDALENAVRSQKVRVLGLLDERDAGRENGATDTADWVALTSRVRTSTARTLVSAARNLRDLPAVHRVADEGRLSFDQLAPIARIATPETDAHWATTGPGCAPATLDAIASGPRAVSTDEANERHRQRSLRWWRDGRIGMWRFSARLPDELGATVITALERAYAQQQPNADGLRDPGNVRAADALIELASARLHHDPDPARATIVVHVPEDEAPIIDAGEAPIALETARRLVRDGTLQLLVKDALGNPVGLSSRRRTVSPALARVLRHRDRRCRFPGCERSRGVQAHHIEHAADGGRTEASNLVCLCPFHHRFLHEGRWRIEGDPAKPDGLVFRRPDGRVFTGHGPPVDPEIRARFLDVA